MKKIVLMMCFLCIGIVSAGYNCTIYDDFSNPLLNTSKWNISKHLENNHPLADYGIDNNTGVFYITKSESEDKRTYLVPTYNFSLNDTFSFVVNYTNGIGNRIFQIMLVENNGNKRSKLFSIGEWGEKKLKELNKEAFYVNLKYC